MVECKVIPRDEAVKLLNKLPRETAIRVYQIPATLNTEGELMIFADIEQLDTLKMALLIF
jgi:hypothetical protein